MFKPDRILFEQDALTYPKGEKLYQDFKEKGEKIEILNTANRVTSIPGENKREKYENAKKTLVVGVRKTLKFENCKPSAHYQLPLVTGCMGMCEYCYLNTNLATRSYIRVYVNTDEILEKAKEYIEERSPEITIFEGAATSDPTPVEEYTHNLADTITFLGEEEKGRFRFVTKYPYIDSLLSLNHNGHTEIRFSLNTQYIIKEYEHKTASMQKRIEAIGKVKKAGYPVGVILAPVFFYENWKEEYLELLKTLKGELEKKNLGTDISFEIITHRYTLNAKNKIQEFYPETTLPMKEEERRFQYGQFGYGKYLYPKEKIEEAKQFFQKEIETLFTDAKILYMI